MCAVMFPSRGWSQFHPLKIGRDILNRYSPISCRRYTQDNALCCEPLNHRRVVVTGMGLVTPLGVGTWHCWNRLINSESGIGFITRFDPSNLPVKIAAQVPYGPGIGEYDPSVLLDRLDLNQTSRASRYALVAAKEALINANLTLSDSKLMMRTGVSIGCGMGSMEDIELACETYYNKGGYGKVSPFFIPKMMVNAPAGQIAIKFGFSGPNLAVSTACASGAHSIGDAFRLIQNGIVDIMVAGAVEASITPLTIAGFSRAKSLSTHFQEKPSKSSRPFDRDRDGFVIGEGSGILILEDLQHAMNRKATIYAELRGYGQSCDAHHITSPHPNGKGGLDAMLMAVKQSGFQPHHVQYINAHATSTPVGDLIEDLAIYRFKQFFEKKSETFHISSTKGSIGHLLGAAGAVESIFTILAIYNGIVPPTLNLITKDPQLKMQPVGEKAISVPVKVAISNSFGFGGTNASLLFSKYS